tara:strand:+ start:373 stop:591 length:219 start_codon:yes stop_codon:yes gene_type:complete
MEKKEVKAKKPVAKKTVKKAVKVELKDKLTEIAEFIDKTIKEERGKQLNTSSCARLGKVKQDLLFIARNIIK